MPKITNYITKSDFRSALFDQEKSLLKKIDEKSKKYRDEILTKMDGVMKELETMREENTLVWVKQGNSGKKLVNMKNE